jgi:hypothetical protein
LGTAAARGATETATSPRLEQAEHDARLIRAEGSRWGSALASLIDCGLHACRGHRPELLDALDRAEAEIEAAQVGGLLAAVIRRRRGQVLGGVAGAQQKEAADAWLTSRGIRRPERIADIYLPGHFS